MSYIDAPGKKPKHPHYEHRTEKLDRKDNDFTCKKFHHVRKVSTHKEILKSLGRLGMCLNDKPVDHLQNGEFEKVCFIIINDYEDKHKYELGVGPLNDGYLIALKFHKLDFKIFYLYNSESDVFSNYMAFFLKRTSEQLTVFYSGRVTNKNSGISFTKTALIKETIGRIVEANYTGNTKLVFITDSIGSGPAFTINTEPHKNMTSISVDKTADPRSIEYEQSHGIFTYYFCKIISENPNITPNALAEKMDSYLSRFGEKIRIENSDSSLAESSLYL